MRILVVTAHPHYAATYCAGTLYQHAQRGDEVLVVSLTAGELMTDRVSPTELAAINTRDLETAANLLGIKETRVLGFSDAEIENSPETRMVLNNVIRELTPDIVITHWPQDTHPDYRHTGQATLDACFFALLVSGSWASSLRSHWTSKAYAFEIPGLSLDFTPDTYIDITGVMDVKIASIDTFAIHCQANFSGDLERFRSSIIGPNRRYGLESGVMYAEAFRRLDLHEVHNKAGTYLTT